MPHRKGQRLVSPDPGATSQAGIWVTGLGSLTVDPDLASLNIGVTTQAEIRDDTSRAALQVKRWS